MTGFRGADWSFSSYLEVSCVLTFYRRTDINNIRISAYLLYRDNVLMFLSTFWSIQLGIAVIAQATTLSDCTAGKKGCNFCLLEFDQHFYFWIEAYSFQTSAVWSPFDMMRNEC